MADGGGELAECALVAAFPVAFIVGQDKVDMVLCAIAIDGTALDRPAAADFSLFRRAAAYFVFNVFEHAGHVREVPA